MTTASRVSDSREAFEKWAESRGYVIARYKALPDMYTDSFLNAAWAGYQAAISHQGDAADISADRNWCAGAQWGFGRGLENDHVSLAEAIEGRRREIRDSKRGHRGEVVKVSELRTLVGTWQRKADGLGFPYGEDYLGCGRDLTALISKAEKV